MITIGRRNPRAIFSPFVRRRSILLYVGKWSTVTVFDADGRRHSLDVLASSAYEAAHLFLHTAKENRASAPPIPTRETIFEIACEGKIHRVSGAKLREWIQRRRDELGGPAGYLFSKASGDGMNYFPVRPPWRAIPAEVISTRANAGRCVHPTPDRCCSSILRTGARAQESRLRRPSSRSRIASSRTASSSASPCIEQFGLAQTVTILTSLTKPLHDRGRGRSRARVGRCPGRSRYSRSG